MRFTLALLPNGSAILATPEQIPDDQVEHLREVFKEWSEAQPPQALIVGQCDVVRVTEVELELAEAGA